jgi:hypothetical protein
MATLHVYLTTHVNIQTQIQHAFGQFGFGLGVDPS